MRLLHSVVVALVVCVSGPSFEVMQAHAGAKTWEIEGKAGHRRVWVHPDRPTVITFSSNVWRLGPPKDWKVYVDLLQSSDTIVLYPRPEARPEEYAGTLVVSTGRYTANVIVEPADSPDEADDTIAVVHVDERAMYETAVKATAERIAAEETAKLKAQHAKELEAERARHQDEIERLKRQGKATGKREAEQAKTIADLTAKVAALTGQLDALNAEIDALTRKNEALTAQLAAERDQHEQERAEWERHELAMVRSHTQRHLLDKAAKHPTEIWIPDEEDRGDGVRIERARWNGWADLRTLHFDIVNPDPTAYRVAELQLFNEHKTRNHAGEIKIGSNDEPPMPIDGVLVTVPPRGRLEMAVAVDDAESVGRYMHLYLREPGGERPVSREGMPTWTWKTPANENEGKVTVSVVGTYGAMWIPNPEAQSLAGELNATDIKGLGMTIRYGLHKRFDFEAAAIYASTGDAHFDGGLRSAKLGRVQVGGLLRLGSGRYIPVVRGGIGLQGANYSGLGDGFEFDLTWSVGGGLDIKAGPFVLALGLSSGQPMSGASRWVGGELQIGYAWKP